MKRMFGVLLGLVAIAVVAYYMLAPVEVSFAPPAGDRKVAIITNTVSQNEEEYRSAQQMVDKYGDRIVHVMWPDNFMAEQEQMVGILSKLAHDSSIKAVIINQAVPGTNPAIDKLREIRRDVFIVYASPQENPPDVAEKAHLILMPDELEMGNTIPMQAQKLGAKVFVHYSFPRHMSQVLLSGRRELMKAKCAELGIEFVDATAPDPMGDSGLPGAQQFILEDVPKMVEKYGKDTAFFSTNCAMQIPLIKSVVDTGAIYPQPCCPSPYHGFPTALGVESDLSRTDNLQHVIDETRRILKEKGVEGRLSTWPVPAAMMFTIAGTEYAFKVIDGELPLGTLDIREIERCMANYAGVEVKSSAYVDEVTGRAYNNFRFVLMDFLTY
ncbi:MAG: DUF3798 domain-containing protein [Synergistaceae bacterium]|nr:DUF3798 domain-containing protein [Synergistota bacterium]NLM70531.1 DUF3798 domain-containing protein [Synergistaceae bacterium]